MNEIIEVLQNVGFPVASVIACGLYINKQQQENREDMLRREQQQREDTERREERMYSQLDKFGDSMDKFNDTLINIDNRLQKLENRKED